MACYTKAFFIRYRHILQRIQHQSSIEEVLSVSDYRCLKLTQAFYDVM